MEVLPALSLLQLLLWTGLALGQGYLEGEHRPLWILDDGLTKRQRQDRPEADYATTTRQPLMRRQGRGGQEPGPITFLVRHEDREQEPPPPARRRMPSLPQRRFMMPHRLQLPHQYVQPNQRTRSSTRSSTRSTPYRREGRRQLPVFDNAPGENTLEAGRNNYPIFVYNGTRGELILNTMLSRRRYPMQEPVPGQVLYPPSTPMFRPKPIVERFRLPGQREMLNLTLIPFYAHEAISNPGLASTQALTTTPATPTPPPSPAYETQLPRSQEALGKRKRKKAKQYEAFHSPQEVMQWQSVLRRSTGHDHDQDRNNHRHYSSEELQPQQEQEQEQEEFHVEEEQEEEDSVSQDWVTEQETETEVELPPEPEPETSTAAASSSPFQIVYLDDSLERPATSTTATDPTPPLRQSSRYALKREYYAFPVYTLGKLLQPQPKKLLEKSDRAARSSSERGPNTWFILNSRYKGPHHRALLGSDNQTKYYTSKYMESGSRPRR